MMIMHKLALMTLVMSPVLTMGTSSPVGVVLPQGRRRSNRIRARVPNYPFIERAEHIATRRTSDFTKYAKGLNGQMDNNVDMKYVKEQVKLIKLLYRGMLNEDKNDKINNIDSIVNNVEELVDTVQLMFEHLDNRDKIIENIVHEKDYLVKSKYVVECRIDEARKVVSDSRMIRDNLRLDIDYLKAQQQERDIFWKERLEAAEAQECSKCEMWKNCFTKANEGYNRLIKNNEEASAHLLWWQEHDDKGMETARALLEGTVEPSVRQFLVEHFNLEQEEQVASAAVGASAPGGN